MQESKDKAEAAAKIMDLCVSNTGNNNGNGLPGIAQNGEKGSVFLQQQVHWKSSHGSVQFQQGSKAREVNVFFYVNFVFVACFLE
uniref:Uncharacterized protein n=1 Tax=Rhizophora mucronata TaxID=61149 RepID=A0A2P2PI32_RHIMU